jgi:hypothetical protein
MPQPPDDDDRQQGSWAGLIAAIVLVVLGVWLFNAFHKSSETLDCIAAGHHNCVPAPGQ